MCGIYGFSARKNFNILKEMGHILHHRGPDDMQCYQSEKISMGIARLSIVDIQSGTQPWTEIHTKVSVVCNGEIYNFRALRQLLIDKGYKLKSDHSDTEVLPYLYLEYGIDFVKKIDGMFAIALYDHHKDSLFLIRDRIGKKPLYYRIINSEIYFASEIKGLLTVGSTPNINQASLSHYFSFKNSLAPQTIYEGIYALEPAQYIEFKNNKSSTKAYYWDINFKGENDASSKLDIENALIELLEDSVKRRTDVDVPYGVFLSGGLDSSLISAIAQNQSSNNLHSFTLSFSDDIEGKNSDTHYAKTYATMLGTQHHDLILDSQDVFRNLSNVLQSFDEPFSGTISTYFLSKYITEYVKVALSGDGSDELFGSYLTHRIASIFDSQQNLSPYLNTPDYQKILTMNLQNNPSWREEFFVFKRQEHSQLLKHPPMNFIQLQNNKSVSELHQTLESEFKYQLPNQILTFSDKLSMAHSLEIRSPFLDTRFIEFVATIPSKYKIDQGEVKAILKSASLKYLPKELAYRQKEGFVLPVYKWIENDYLNIVKSSVLDSRIYDDINRNYVEELFKKFEKNKNNHAKIWSLYNYAIWKDTIYR